MEKDTAKDEIQNALNSINNRTRIAVAQVNMLYTRKHRDGKHYIQVQALLPDGTRLPGYLPFGFTTKQTALQFQKMCFKWLVKQN